MIPSLVLIRVIIIDFVSEWCMDIVTISSNSEEMYQYYRIKAPKLTLNFIHFLKIYLIYVIVYKNSNDPQLYHMHIKWTYFNVVWYINEMRNFSVTIRAKKVIPTCLNNENLKRGACFLAYKVISELSQNRSLQKIKTFHSSYLMDSRWGLSQCHLKLWRQTA